MTAYQVKKSLDTLTCWPSRRRSFIQHRHRKEGIIVLRPITARWVKAYRAVWDSSLPDSYKDVLFFVWSQFAGKVPHSGGEFNTMENLGASDGESDPMENRGGKALFRCSLFGRQQPSIWRCCYVGGRNKMRKHMVSDMVSCMVKVGLLVVRDMATSRSAMLCEEPSEETIRTLQNRCSVQNDSTRNLAGNPAEKHAEPSGPTRGTQRKQVRNPAEKREEPTFSEPFSKPTRTTPFQNPFSKAPLIVASAACSSRGAASQPDPRGGEQSHTLCDSLASQRKPPTPDGRRVPSNWARQFGCSGRLSRLLTLGGCRRRRNRGNLEAPPEGKPPSLDSTSRSLHDFLIGKQERSSPPCS